MKNNAMKQLGIALLLLVTLIGAGITVYELRSIPAVAGGWEVSG